MHWFKWTYFHDRVLLFLQRWCQSHDTANAANRGHRRIPATGRGGYVPLLGGDRWQWERQERKALRSYKQLFRLLASLLQAALLKIVRGKVDLVVVRRKYFIEFVFEPTWLAPQVPCNSSTNQDALCDFIRCPQFVLTYQLLHRHPTRTNHRMSSMTKGVTKYADLDDQFNHFHWSTRWHVDKNAMESCRVAGTFNLTWEERPSSEKSGGWSCTIRRQ